MKNLMFCIVAIIVSFGFASSTQGQNEGIVSGRLEPVSIPESVQKDVAAFERSLVQAESNYLRLTIQATKKLQADLSREIVNAEKANSDNLVPLKNFKKKADQHLEQLENRLKELSEPPVSSTKNAQAPHITTMGRFNKNDIIEINVTGKWSPSMNGAKFNVCDADGMKDQNDGKLADGTFVVSVVNDPSEHNRNLISAVKFRSRPNRVGSGGVFKISSFDENDAYLYGYCYKRSATAGQSGVLKVTITSKKDHIGVWNDFQIKPIIRTPFS